MYPFSCGPSRTGGEDIFFSGRGSVSCVVVGRGGAQVAGGSPVASLDQNEPFVRRIRMGTRRRTPMNQQERVLFQLTRRLQAVSHAKELPSLLRRGEPDASYRQRRASRELKFVRVRSRRKRIRARLNV